jgi:hypothetical protein
VETLWVEAGWMSWLAKATELLETADRKAGEKIEKVKERAGIQRPTEDTDDSVQLSAAAVALLEKSRGCASASGAAESTAGDDASRVDPAPVTPAALGLAEGLNATIDAAAGTAVPDAAAQQQRRARLAEWEALGQDILILTEHGRKLQQRLAASALALERSKAAEAQARSQLQEALAAALVADRAKASAEHAADAARGTQQTALTQLELRLGQSEETVAAHQAQVGELQRELLVARQREAAVAERQQAIHLS